MVIDFVLLLEKSDSPLLLPFVFVWKRRGSAWTHAKRAINSQFGYRWQIPCKVFGLLFGALKADEQHFEQKGVIFGGALFACSALKNE
jgi:hypothetical protein